MSEAVSALNCDFLWFQIGGWGQEIKSQFAKVMTLHLDGNTLTLGTEGWN